MNGAAEAIARLCHDGAAATSRGAAARNNILRFNNPSHVDAGSCRVGTFSSSLGTERNQSLSKVTHPRGFAGGAFQRARITDFDADGDADQLLHVTLQLCARVRASFARTVGQSLDKYCDFIEPLGPRDIDAIVRGETLAPQDLLLDLHREQVDA